MKFDAYIEERVVRMAFELKMLVVIEGWHIRRLRMRVAPLIIALYRALRFQRPDNLTPRYYAMIYRRRGYGVISLAANRVNRNMIQYPRW